MVAMSAFRNGIPPSLFELVNLAPALVAAPLWALPLAAARQKTPAQTGRAPEEATVRTACDGG